MKENRDIKTENTDGDLILLNEHIEIIMNGSVIENPTSGIFSDVSSLFYNVEMEPERTDEMEYIAASNGQDGSAYYSTYHITVDDALSYYHASAYRITTKRNTTDYEVLWNITVILPDNRSYFLVHIELENIDNEPIVIDEYPSHIHNGINILRQLRGLLGTGQESFPDSTSDDHLYIHGQGEVPFVGTTYWSSYPADSEKPFFTMYDGASGDGFTVGYLDGNTSANQIIPFYRMDADSPIQAKVDFTVGEAIIPVGEIFTYNFFIGLHDKDEISGEELYTIIASEYKDIFGEISNKAPDQPTNPNPSDGFTGVDLNPMLQLNVCDPDGDKVNVYFYNALDQSLIGIDLGVSSGEKASIIWPNLSENSNYSWYVIVDDGTINVTSPTWAFTTMSVNEAPNRLGLILFFFYKNSLSNQFYLIIPVLIICLIIGGSIIGILLVYEYFFKSQKEEKEKKRSKIKEKLKKGAKKLIPIAVGLVAGIFFPPARNILYNFLKEKID